MAARYWVGGTGNWSDATNHWSDTSGGAPGAGFLPTSADDVYFDANSFSVANTWVYINGIYSCKDIDTTELSYSGRLYINSGMQLYINGSLYNIGSDFSFNSYSNNYSYIFTATTNCFIDLNGGIIYTVRFDGIGGSWTLLSDLTDINFINIVNGTFDANGFDISVNMFQSQTGTSFFYLRTGLLIARSWNIGSSTTFYCGTGTVKLSSSLYGASHTFYNLILAPDFIISQLILNITASPTIINLLTLQGINSTTKRGFIRKSENYNTTPITLTAESVYAENIDLFMIKGAGNADWDLSVITGLSGDAGFNQDIIFTTPQPQYYKYISGDCYWSNTVHWFPLTNGGGGAGRIPLPQDKAVFDENSFSSSATLRCDIPLLGKDINMVDVDVALTLSLYNADYTAIAYYCFGDFILGSNISVNDTKNYFHIWSSFDLSVSLFGQTLNYLYVYNSGITCTFLTDGKIRATLNNYGKFILGDNYLTVGSFYMPGSELWLNNGTIEFTTGGLQYNGPLIVHEGMSTLYFNPASGSSNIRVLLYYKNFYNIIFGGNHTGAFRLGTGQGQTYTNPANFWAFNSITINAGKTLQIGTQQFINTNYFVAIGTSFSKIFLTTFSVSGPFANHELTNLSTSDIIVEHCDISYSTVTGTPKIKTFLGKTWASISKAAGIAKASIKRIMGVYVNSAWIANNSTDSGNNSGWTFNP